MDGGWVALSAIVTGFFGWLIARDKKGMRLMRLKLLDLEREMLACRSESAMFREDARRANDERTRSAQELREVEHTNRNLQAKVIGMQERMDRMEAEEAERERERQMERERRSQGGRGGHGR